MSAAVAAAAALARRLVHLTQEVSYRVRVLEHYVQRQRTDLGRRACHIGHLSNVFIASTYAARTGSAVPSHAKAIEPNSNRNPISLSPHCPSVFVACSSFNRLKFKSNYSATSNNMKSVHWPLMGVTFGTARRVLGWLLYNSPLLCGFNVPIKGLTRLFVGELFLDGGPLHQRAVPLALYILGKALQNLSTLHVKTCQPQFNAQLQRLNDARLRPSRGLHVGLQSLSST